MLCPECREPMVAFELFGVEIDSCMRCGGLWLDAGEIEMICQLAKVGSGPLNAGLRSAAVVKSGRKRPCPRCRKKMVLIEIPTARDGAEAGEPQETLILDRCPLGQGFWFDRGELAQALKRFNSAHEETAAIAAFLGNMFGHKLNEH